MSAETVPAAPPTPPSQEVIAPGVSVQAYLEMERTSPTRHEYVDGEIIAMAGETLQHNRIARNVCLQLELAFGDRPCESFVENVRVRVTPTQYRYPDVVALCGAPMVDDSKPPVLLNPSVVVEVLSPSTEDTDRDEKFMEYRQLPSVTDYILIAQDAILVVHYARQSQTQWLLTEYSQLKDRLTLASLEVSLPLADIYRKIVFASSAPAASVQAS